MARLGNESSGGNKSKQPCKYINTPEGCNRPNCEFSHALKGVLCKFTIKGEECPQGDACIWAHTKLQENAKPLQSMTRKLDQKGSVKPSATVDSPLEVQLRRWRYHTLDTSSPDKPLSKHVRNKFFQEALSLVLSDSATMQSVINALSSDGGTKRILEIVKQEFRSRPIKAQKDALSSLILPFFKVISFSKALTSGLLEASRSITYNTIYGPGGQYGLNLFGFIAEIADTLSVEDLEPILAVFSKMIELNGSAELVHGFTEIVETLSVAVASVEDDRGDLTIIKTQKWLERAKSRLGIGKPMVELTCTTKNTPHPKAKFEFEIDLPGQLSKIGARHDNDFDDIGQIQILPTFEEIMCNRGPYLPTLNPSMHHLEGTKRLFDRHFRLYREDVVGQIRDAVRFALDHHGSHNTQSNVLRTNQYVNLVFEHLHCDKLHGLMTTISVDQPKGLENLSRKGREEWWELRKRLHKDSMVCILDISERHAIFCTVSEKRGKTSMAQDTDDERVGEEAKIPLYDLGSDPQRATVTLALAEEKDVHRIVDYFINRRPSQAVILLEFPKVLLQAFRPTLAALQAMATEQDMPFADLLAPSQAASGLVEIGPPSYVQQRNFEFDLSCLLSNKQNLSLSSKGGFDMKTLINNSTLDGKQAEALVHTLSQRLALCQGPPGTGKSYTGVALTRVLLANKKAADLGPILVVCYTNHALDQLLEHFIDTGIERIIRVGGRSKSEQLEGLNLRDVSRMMERTRTEKQEYYGRDKTLKADAAFVNEAIVCLRRANTFENLRSYLEANYPEFHEQFWGVDEVKQNTSITPDPY